MKKIFLAVIAIATVALVGCEKSKKDEPTPPSVDTVYVYLDFRVETFPLVSHDAIMKDTRDKIGQDLYNAVEKTIWTEPQWLVMDTMPVLDKAVKALEVVAAKYSNGLFNGKISFNILKRNSKPISKYLYRDFMITPADEVYEYNYAYLQGQGAADFKTAVDDWIYEFDKNKPNQSLEDTATIYEAMNALIAQYRHKQLDGTFVVELTSDEKGVLWHKEWNEVSHPSYNVGWIKTTQIMPGFEQIWASLVKDYEELREKTEPSANQDDIKKIIADWVNEKKLEDKFALATFEQIVSYDNWEQAHESPSGGIMVHIGHDVNGIDTQYVKGEDKDALISALQTAMVDWEKAGLCYGQLDAFTNAIKDVCRKYPNAEGKIYIKALCPDSSIRMGNVATIWLPIK